MDETIVVITLKILEDSIWGMFDEIRLCVKHGTGQASGKAWVQVDVYRESVLVTEAGGWQILKGKLVNLYFENPPKGSTGHKLKRIIDQSLAENPEELKKITTALQS